MKRTDKRVAGAVMLCAVLAGGTAWAATKKYVLQDNSKPTQTSGNEGGRTLSTSPGGDYQGIYEISMWEGNDVPCRVRGRSRHLNTYMGKNFEYKHDSCGSKSEKTLTFAQEDTYITGIQVCLNGKGERVKGVKVFGKKLNRNTGVLTDAGSKQFERPHCANWKPARHCPAGKIATGFLVYEVDDYYDPISGLGLFCRSVVAQ